MPTTKENYQISATDMAGVVQRINFVLARIADRLDKLEGLRGELETESGTFSGDIISKKNVIVKDADDNTIHSME